ncbi:ribD [Wigglesworthia glossinidia endosymbiont of Glossina brevipalpis]|uniref:Riboflavin biosynthesis protein RibD n=1 Tax=Wigglesworthia glossinidia brevipalpis TaxID=36870 RepID=Q8D292_WIGBR|nr:ribD [Wigglesworthia glossinidia endosymbiont of Glossina brevipalpis]
MINKEDLTYLNRAFNLAELGKFTTHPNPNVGCVIVLNKSIVGEGYHKIPGSDHAEICALKLAGKYAKGSTVYVTLEPCSHHGKTPSCAQALINAKVKEVIASAVDPNPLVSGKGFSMLKNAGIKVKYNIMSEKSIKLNLGFFKRMKYGIPWITLKLGSSIDGRTATKKGISKWITSVESRKDVQVLRAKSGAILSSAKTVIEDNSKLTVRWNDLPNNVKLKYSLKEERQPIRIIIDNSNKILNSHDIIKHKGIIFLVRSLNDNLTWPRHVKQIICSTCKKFSKTKTIRTDLFKLMILLGKNEINSVLIESGANLSGSFLLSGLLDEIILYQSPKILGEKGLPLFFLHKSFKLNLSPKFVISDVCRIGEDVRFKLHPYIRKFKIN